MTFTSTFIHEPAYLTGVAAGLMTETGKIGIVANFPLPNVNAPVNGYIVGAKSVNPDVEWEVTFIESWWATSWTCRRGPRRGPHQHRGQVGPGHRGDHRRLWYQTVNGIPMDAPMERIMFQVPQGGGDIAPLNEALVPDDVRDRVLEARDQILSGELVAELDDAPPE